MQQQEEKSLQSKRAAGDELPPPVTPRSHWMRAATT
jgi:hypothetical protein